MNNTTDLQVLQSILYNKSYTCPLCDQAFTQKAIKLGKNQVTTIDSDLHTHFAIVSPLLYDIIACPECGYTAHHQTYDKLLPKQRDWLRELFAPPYKPYEYPEYMDNKLAIHKHKMALMAAMVKKAKISEQAYLALHIAWLYRDIEDYPSELSFLKRAYNGFKEAYSKENFPIFNIDEMTLAYMLADIAYRLEKTDESKQFLSTILSNVSVSPRIKDRALDLRNKIRAKA